MQVVTRKRSIASPVASLFFGSVTEALSLVCLAGCSSTAAAIPATHSAAAPRSSNVPASDTAHVQGAVTCTALSVMWTELENARAAHDSGKLSDAGTAAIFNTVPTTLTLLRMDEDAGLKDNLRNLAVDLTFTKPKVAGAVFDPNAAPFFTTMNQAMAACQQNGTPAWIQGPPGQG